MAVIATGGYYGQSCYKHPWINFVCERIFIFKRVVWTSSLLIYWQIFCLIFNIWKPLTVCQSHWGILQILTNNIRRFHFLPNLLSVGFVFLLQSSQWARNDTSLWLICISLMANNSEYFSYAYSIREIFLYTLCPDFNWVIWSFVSSCREYLHIVDASPLSDAQLVIIC